MSPRAWKFRIEDISDALDKINLYVEGLTFENWLKDQKTIDAVVRNFEIVGEAAARVPANIQEQIPEIPWYQLKAMRNVLIHEYFGVDNEVIWRTIQNDLPPLRDKIRKILI